MGRGAAFADIDADGDLDAVISTNGGPVALYRSDLPPGNRSLRLRLPARHVEPRRHRRPRHGQRRQGVRDARRAHRNELPVAVGAAADVRPRPGGKSRRGHVVWPSGRRDVLGALDAGQEYTVTEGKGVTGKRAGRPRRP